MLHTDNNTISSGANEMTFNNPKTDNSQHSLKEEAEIEIEIDTESDCNVPAHNDVNQDSNKPTIVNTQQSFQQLPQLPPQLTDHNYPPNHDLYHDQNMHMHDMNMDMNMKMNIGHHHNENENENENENKHQRPLTPQEHEQQQQQQQQFANIQHQNITEHQDLIPNTPVLSHSAQIQPPNTHQQPMYHQFSQSCDFSMNHHQHPYHSPLAWSQPHPHYQNMHLQPHPHHNPQPIYSHNASLLQTSHNNLANISHFAPQKLTFQSNSSSLVNTNTSTIQNSNSLFNSQQLQTSRSNDLHLPHILTPSVMKNKTVNSGRDHLDEIKEMTEHETNPKSSNLETQTQTQMQTETEVKANTNENGDVEIMNLDIDIEDDDNLFMPVTPTLSGSALRALLSQLRRKCRNLQFKSKQQNKFIIDMQTKLTELQAIISNSKLKAYDQEQNILMLQNQEDMNTLEYLRGAELHQTRQELAFMMSKMTELEANNHELKHQLKLQELDHETYNKSLKEEYQRLLREINQHKVLFDQRGREIKQLKQSSDNEKSQYDGKLAEITRLKETDRNKLETVSEQLSALRNDYEKLKKEYDDTYAEKEKHKNSLRDAHLQMDGKDQNILSLKRVKENLEQEIEALTRSNRNFREIRDKSTTQLLESQQHEIDCIKQQVAQQYDRYLEEQ